VLLMKVIHERFPYRFTENGLLETNGQPDYRIQKWNELTDRYRDMFYLDSAIQLDMALEDREYVKWLDPDPDVASYRKTKGNVVTSPYT